MAVIEWGDTFDHYTKDGLTTFTASHLARKWTAQTNPSETNPWVVGPAYALPGAHGGNGIQAGGSTGRPLTKNLPGGAQATRCISVWFNPAGAAAGVALLIAFFDAGAEQVSVRLDATAHLTISRNGTLLATSTNVLSANTWYHLMFKATIHNTAGNYELKVNGSSVGWVPAQGGTANTRVSANNSATTVALYNNGTGWMFDDFVVTDDFPAGPIVGTYLRPAGAGNYQQWVANSGDNRGAVASPSMDDDNSFNATATAGAIDTFAMEKLPSGGAPAILGIQQVLLVKQDAGVQRVVRPKQRSAGVDYNGTSVNATSGGYALITEAKSVNPATSAAYTKTSLEAAEMGYENV